MSAEAKINVAEGEHGDVASVSQVQGNEISNQETSAGGVGQKDDEVVENQQLGANKAHTEPKVHVSAHEQDRKEQASRRIKEAQQYHKRDKGPRGSGQGGRGYRNGNRFDPSTQEKSDDPVAIRKQVEFYFSESNLLTDKFLFGKVEGHKNVPVPIDVINSFKRMQRFQPREVVVEALKESLVLEVVDDDTAVRRKEPLPENLTGKSMDEVQKVHEDRSMAKSIYAKGFGEEEPTTQFDIEAWFANYGLTNSVRLRRDHNKGFKGSVFVEFDTEETQRTFLSLDPPAKWRGKELEIKSKKQYCDAKVDDINNGRIRRNSPHTRHEDRRDKRQPRGSPTYDDKRHQDAKGDDDRDWRQRRNDEVANGSRSFKQKGRESSGRRDRKHHQIEREGASRKEKNPEIVDPTSVEAPTPELSAIDTTKEENHLGEGTSSHENATLPADTTTAGDPAKRKRSEDKGDDEIQPDTKKVDLKINSG